MPLRKPTLLVAALAAGALLTGGTALSASAAPERADTTMNGSFASAAERYDVPRDVLVSLGYSETHLDGHQGKPSQDRGYGVMHLVSNPTRHTLEKAAELTGTPVAELRRDTDANIHGGAAVLRAYADQLGLNAEQRQDIDAWYPVIEKYSGAKGTAAEFYADAVYDFLAKGVNGAAPNGERVTVRPHDVHPDKSSATRSDTRPKSDDYPDALWVPANPANYRQGRTAAIDTVVIHVTEGSYAGTISWFQNPESQVSAHYVVQSSDGEITQMVRDADTAWHAKSGNASGIGIEHEGYIDDPSWFTDAMYRSSAALTRHLADTYGIPLDREHIVGHSEVPGNDHTDPGPNWDWDTYMSLVTG